MAIEVEANLRVPKVKVPTLGEDGYPIDNSTVRFAKRITVPAIPKPGASLQLTINPDTTFECDVTRVDWNEEKEMFVLDCRYSRKSIPPGEYAALIKDSDWKMKQLL